MQQKHTLKHTLELELCLTTKSHPRIGIVPHNKITPSNRSCASQHAPTTGIETHKKPHVLEIGKLDDARDPTSKKINFAHT